MGTIRVRPYRDADEARVLSWCEDERTFRMWTAGVLGPYPLTPSRFRKTGEYMRFVALDGREVVGFFIVRNPTGTPEDLRFGFVIVDPARRGAGVGRAMLGLGLDFAFGIYKAERVTLCVLEGNRAARACYASIGFVETGVLETYCIEGEECHAREMECTRDAWNRPLC